MNNRIVSFALLLGLSLFGASCQLRPLENPEESVEVRVIVELKNISNITQDIYNERIPVPNISTDMVRVMFYNPSTGRLISQSFISNKTVTAEGYECLSGTVKITPGTYNMVCYNFDTANTLVRDENSYAAMTAYTSEVSSYIKSHYIASRAKIAVSEMPEELNYEPDHLVVAREPELVIAPHTGLLVIETSAVTCVDTYYLQVHCTGMQYASAMSAFLTGMSPSNNFALDIRNTADPTALYFELQKSQDDKIAGSNKDVLCTLFNTFGKINTSDSDLSISFNITTTDGEDHSYIIPMNKVFETEDAQKRHWLLIEDTIDIPEPPKKDTGGGGFQPEVHEWEEEHGNIPL